MTPPTQRSGPPVAQLYSVYAGDDTTAAVILDVRQDSEWASGHVPGAIHAELGALANTAAKRASLAQRARAAAHDLGEDAERRRRDRRGRGESGDDVGPFNPIDFDVFEVGGPDIPGIRVDTGVTSGSEVPPYYDSMVAKVICQGRNREEALRRMQMALESFIIEGVTTTIPFLAKVMQNPRFMAGDVDTKFLERETDLFKDLKETAHS